MSRPNLLGSAAALATALFLAAPVSAQSSSMTVDGVTVTITGGGSQSVTSVDGGTRIGLNGNVFELYQDRVVIDGEVMETSGFTEAEIDSTDGVKLFLDGALFYEMTEAQVLQAAVDDGDIDAMNDLGLLYVEGEGGVEQDYARGIELMTAAAEGGNQYAQANLAFAYNTGKWGVAQDEAQARDYAGLSAEQGNLIAMRLYGGLLLYGEGGEADIPTGLQMLTTAAESGDALAMNALGVAYGTPDFGVQDAAAGTEWYRRGAEAGLAVSQSNYGFALLNGTGTEADPAEAYRWFLAAAEQGNIVAMRKTGELLANGTGVEADLVAARDWLSQAAAGGDEPAADMLEQLDAYEAGLTEEGATDTDDASTEETSTPPDLPPAEAAIYFYAEAGEPIGPVTLTDLRAALGTLGPDTLIWSDGMADWTPAAQVEGIVAK
ncbi:GYF domain-containing protein [Pelagovum pacificum]|uniref:DUF4339 domain-containing protein n=1 Tax=Pelagovum pacificum TaxID=2588711 RepID=A0A5C5GEA6_9RHOB|nr:GYF domain-containing protein [Pelagovum pacificum]QQA44031.1 SEL1-like repeat protein [Pelagovum pacificum]TNY32840.1 DUF4339 domain-containing protein [Pelagovum pacificum]